MSHTMFLPLFVECFLSVSMSREFSFYFTTPCTLKVVCIFFSIVIVCISYSGFYINYGILLTVCNFLSFVVPPISYCSILWFRLLPSYSAKSVSFLLGDRLPAAMNLSPSFLPLFILFFGCNNFGSSTVQCHLNSWTVLTMETWFKGKKMIQLSDLYFCNYLLWIGLEQDYCLIDFSEIFQLMY